MISPCALAQTAGDRVDLYFGDWRKTASHKVQGALEERDVLTRGDALNPPKAGAVLRTIDAFTHDVLPPHASTTATRLTGQQEILFVESGQGTATAGSQTEQLFRNIAILVPANLEFTLKNTGDKPLGFYIVKEPTPPGFRPNTSMLVRDENKIAISTTDSHWSHIVKPLFATEDGLATLESVLTVTLDPLTIGQPHLSDHPEIEEVWTALDGTSLAFVGNQLRRQTPGMAFYHIPDSKTPHSNINYSQDSQVKFFYFAFYKPHQPRQ
ncbi:cupin domain-containing protein [Granulicella sp. dw_53]|uniref:cupin domain-containing protein n=1 Tax=Granulicella sp. dw_53 TaxID=2719792 RepID=UPI001BD40609